MTKDRAPLGDRRYKINKQKAVAERRDLVKELSWEVARNVIDHHKNVYSEIFKNAPSTFPVSLRNSIFNQIQSAIKCHTDEEICEWIEKSERHRKEMRRLKRISEKAKQANGDTQKINEILKELNS